MRRHAKALIATTVLIATFALGTSTALAASPTVSDEEASKVGVSTARLSGKVNPNGEAGSGSTTWQIQYRATGTEDWSTASEGTIEAPASEEANPVEVETIVSGEPGKTYELRLLAENSAGPDATEAPYPTFTMDAVVEPTLATEPTTGIGYTVATLHGTVDPEGGNANPAGEEVKSIYWNLQYSADGENWSAGGEGWIEGAQAQSSKPIKVSGPLGPGSLKAGQTYQTRLLAFIMDFSREVKSPQPYETFETTAGTKPTVSAPILGPLSADSAHLEGTVDSNAPEDNSALSEDAKAAWATNWQFEYSIDGGASWNGVGGGTVDADDEAKEVEADLALEPNRNYEVRLVASNASGRVESGAVQFTTDAVPADFADSPVWDPTQTTATLTARVNPHNADLTGCHFAYGIGNPAGQQAPCATSPKGNGFQVITAKVSGLTPGSDYHFKLVLTTAEGPMEGAEQTFPTFPETETASETCPNEAIRTEQDARAPECRAYEMVTPLDKNGGDAPAGNDLTVVASVEGNGVSYASRTGFAGTIGSGAIGFTQYLARRGTGGWSSHGITPTSNPHSLQILTGGTRLMLFSDDLSRALVHAYDLPSTSDDILSDVNLYSEDTGSGSLQTISKPLNPDSEYRAFTGGPPRAAASADATHVAFSSRGSKETRFLEEAAPGVENTYEWDNGVLRLAGILPGGKVPPGGSAIKTCGNERCPYRASVSSDGSRIAFLSPAEGERQLYLRRDHTESVWVSEPETTVPVENQQGVNLQWVSPSGKRLLFTTSSGLVDEDTNELRDLYLYADGPEPTEEETNLTMMPAGSAGTVIGADEEATRVFTHTPGSKILLLNEGEIKLVTDSVRWESDFNFENSLGADAAEPGGARVSADGTRLAFLSRDNLTGQDIGEEDLQATRQMYLYDAVADTLTCASCLNGGAVSKSASVRPLVAHTSPTNIAPGSRPRFLSADGRRVFFSTASALVPEDTNGVNDAYLYDAERGQTSLLSPGDTADSVWFQEASLSGEDVFLVTRAQLVGADTDRLIDLYDARVEGGFPEPPPPPAPCSGDGCRGPSSEPPLQTSPATPNFTGPGNRRCKQKGPRCRRHKKAHRKKTQRKKAHHRKRAQNTKQGGGR